MKFSLRALLIAVTLFAPVMAWKASQLKRARAREQLISIILEVGGQGSCPICAQHRRAWESQDSWHEHA